MSDHAGSLVISCVSMNCVYGRIL